MTLKDLKRNWLVVSKLTWEIWKILTGALKSLKNVHFNMLFLNKVYNVWAKKVQRSYVWWHWILMQNWTENWLLLSRMAWNFYQSTSKVSKLGLLWDPFVQSRKCMSLKFTEDLYVRTMKNTKFEEALACPFKIGLRNLKNFDPSTQMYT